MRSVVRGIVGNSPAGPKIQIFDYLKERDIAYKSKRDSAICGTVLPWSDPVI